MTSIASVLTFAATLLAAASLSAQTTVFHYRVNDTDAGGLPTVPSVGGTSGTAQGTFTGLLSADIPTVGVPAGAGNRSLVGAGDANSGGVNSAATQELLNATVIANGGFTYECWFKWNGGGTVNSVIDYAGTEKFRFGGGNLQMNYDQGSGITTLATGVTTGEWHYAAMVFDHDGNPEAGGKISGTMTWYYDDTVVAAGTAAVTKDDFGDSLNRVIGVGRHPQGFAGDNFDGLIYEPRVTLGTLTPAQLLYVPPPIGPTLVASSSASDNSDGTAIQVTVPISNAVGTTLDLNLTAPGLSGTNAADFSVNSFTTPVAANGGTGSVVVDFTPSSGDGIYEATLTINSDDPVNPAFDVALSVDVRDPAIAIPATLDLGTFTAVPAATPNNLSVDNQGGVTALTLSNPQLTGAGAAAWSVTSLPASIPPLGSDVVEVTFNPGVGGSFPATLTIDTNDPRNPQVSVTLSAVVEDPSMVIDASVDLGLLANSPGVVAGAINVSNLGQGSALTLSNPQLTGPAAGNFTLTNSFPLMVAPSGAGTVDFDFDPGTFGGSFLAQATFDTNDPFTPSVTVDLFARVQGAIDLDGPTKVSHWTFDAPGDLGNDSGGFDYDGIVVGDAAPAASSTVGNGAVALDGDGDYIEIPLGSIRYEDLDNDGDGLTVAAWVCSSSGVSPSTRQRYFSKFGGDPLGFGVGQDNDTQLFATTYGVADYPAGGGTLPVQDEWHHVAYVLVGSPPSSIQYYVDGSLVATTGGGAGLGDSVATSFAIGGLGAVAGEWFDGDLDDLRVYASELSAGQVADLAALGIAGAKLAPYDRYVAAAGLAGPDALAGADPDGDDRSNLEEFGEGTDPSVSDSGSLVVIDGSTFTPGSAVTNVDLTSGVDFTLRFVQRADGALDYTVEFSSDMTDWEPSAAVPVVVADDGSGYRVVEISYPFFLGNGRKARFFRFTYTLN